MNSPTKPEIQGTSPQKRTPPSLPSQEVVEARVAAAIEKFKKDAAGKSLEDLADELDAEIAQNATKK